MKNIAQPRDIDEAWRERFSDKLCSAQQAAGRIRCGQRVFLGSGAASPRKLLQAVSSRVESLADMELIQLFYLKEVRACWPVLSSAFHLHRLVADEGGQLRCCTPAELLDVSEAINSGRLPVDVALIQVTAPNRQGWCSLGCSVDIIKETVENASLVLAEVNRFLPWTEGDSLIHVNSIDLLVDAESPLEEFPAPVPVPEAGELSRQVWSLVEDGTTLAPDIDPLTRQILPALAGKKGLGLHTELFSDEIMDLVEAGAMNGACKNIDRGKAVACGCLGSERLYRYLHGNRSFAFCPASYVCQPMVLFRLERLVAISAVAEIDLTGQAALEVEDADGRSWLGSRLDFHRAARRSRKGKSILLLTSTADQGRRSRVVFQLSPGRRVNFTQEDVQYVASEYGVAYLQGKDRQQRALSLISIAHPAFRAELLRQAVACKLVNPELGRLENSLAASAASLRAVMLMDDGTPITFRLVSPTDEARIRSLFYALSEQSVYFRWMANLNRLPEKELYDSLLVDHRSKVALVGTVVAADGEEIVAVGGYELIPGSNRAEVALLVRDKWQKRKIGTFLFELLANTARQNGIAGFTAEVLARNIGMQRIFIEKSGCRVTSWQEEGSCHFELDFE